MGSDGLHNLSEWRLQTNKISRVTPAMPPRYLQVCRDLDCPCYECHFETHITPAGCSPHATCKYTPLMRVGTCATAS